MMTVSLYTKLKVRYVLSKTADLFKYMKERYCQSKVQVLNRILRQKSKYVRACEHAAFVQKCLELWITPHHIQKRVGKAKVKDPGSIERVFMKDEVAKKQEEARTTRVEYTSKWGAAVNDLDFSDMLRFAKLIDVTTARLRHQIQKKNAKTIEYLLRHQHGTKTVNESNLQNLSKQTLTDAEKAVLSRGLNFGVPPTNNPEEILAEFELCWHNLEKETPISTERKKECKAAMAGMAQQYAKVENDRTGYTLEQRHIKAIQELKRKKDLIITRPDKGSGVVLLDRQDYVKKMEPILSQTTKFRKLGKADKQDRTLQEERSLQAFLLKASQRKDLPDKVYDEIRPVGTSRPRMYGVPKTHKEGVPLRPILSMVNSPQHKMAKWLATELKPVVGLYAEHTIKDSFEFCRILEEFAESNPEQLASTFMCSFDITSLFTNIPLQENTSDLPGCPVQG